MMEKYEVTKKHRLLKEGIILEPNGDNCFSSEWAHEFSKDEIEDWFENGWIEEIQEPEFTKKDMADFAVWCVSEWDSPRKSILNYTETLVEWKNRQQ